jgi:glycosyltransferase involved in cell wall biosynthesis
LINSLLYFSSGIVLFFLIIRTIVSFYNCVSKPYLSEELIPLKKEISILIPARNEEKNLAVLLQILINTGEEIKEIIVLDDESSDQTKEIVQKFQILDERIILINGTPLPPNWTGKNWACHQLGNIATGEYLLFLDADVLPSLNLAKRLVTQMSKNKTSLLSVFPDQKMETFGEKVVVPFMHYLLLSLLPLKLVLSNKNPAFAAANGQVMCFVASTYQKNCWHEKVKNSVLDDVNIVKIMKSHGLKTEVVCANNSVFCRMYENFNDAFSGFSKNLFAGFNNNLFGISFYFFIIIFGHFLIWLTFGSIIGIFSVFLSLSIRICISKTAHQPILRNLLLHPLQMLVYFTIGINSVLNTFNKNIIWKGRQIPF